MSSQNVIQEFSRGPELNPQARHIDVCGLIPYPTDYVPGQRFRIEQWAPLLRDEGIDVDMVPFADEALMEILYKPGHTAEKARGFVKAIARRLRSLSDIKRYDVIFLYRSASLIGPALIEKILSWSKVPIIFDFDDAIFLPHASAENARYGWLKAVGKTDAICRMSDCVTVGNQYLAEYASKYSSRVTVIPSSVDIQRFVPRPNPFIRSRPVVGWSGSSTSQVYLEMFSPLLERLFKSRDIQIVVHSDRRPDLNVLFEWRPWSRHNEAQELSNFDIGIMPLLDDPWTRGKCGMKALLYMSSGVPTVCSAVGANMEIITHGRNGFLARNDEDWMSCLTQLVDDPELRLRIGSEGRKTVEACFSSERSAFRLKEVVLSL